MNGIIDSLRTISVGSSGVIITWIDWLPVAVRVAVGIATCFYMVYKAKNEYLKYEENKKGAEK